MKKVEILTEALSGFNAVWMDGIGIIEVDIDAADYFKSFKALPNALKFEGEVYGKTGFNSDKMIAYFRTDRPVAFKL